MSQDPYEQRNLIRDEDHLEVAASMKAKLFTMLTETDGMRVPFLPDKGQQFYYRHPDRANQGEFPKWYYDTSAPVTK